MSVVASVASAMRAYRVAGSLRLPGLLAACIVGGGLIYVAMLAAGVLQLLQGPVVAGILLAAATALHVRALRGDSRVVADTATPWLERLWPQARSGNIQLALVLGLLGSSPVLYLMAAAPFVMVTRGWPLAWDTVSYHLPGFVGFVQDCSLWRLDALFQSYSFGFELIGGFPATFFPSHWGFVVAHYYAVLFLMAAIVLVVERVMGLGGTWSEVGLVLASLLAIALWALKFRRSLWDVGKNDMFLAACILAMLGLLVERAPTGDARRRTFLLFLASAAMSLAVATKPTALAYLPLYGVLVWRQLRYGGGHSSTQATLRALGLIAAVGVGGGFFYVRNLLAFGGLVHPLLVQMAQATSIAANVRNSSLYRLNADSAVLVLAAAALVMLAAWWLRYRTPMYLAVAGFCLTGLAAFTVTPWVVFADDQSRIDGDPLRLGMSFLTVAAVIYAIAVARVVPRLPRIPGRALTAAALVLTLAVLPWWWSDRTPRGLPGGERPRGLPATGVYRFIQSLPTPHRIYAAGVFPYGLYGPRWANRVVYDLSTEALDAPDGGVKHIMTVLETFRPDLVIVAVDAFRREAVEKPQIAWLRSQPFLLEVYCDETVSAFAVVRDDPSKRAWTAARCA